jgi:uncharacterized protein YciI
MAAPGLKEISATLVHHETFVIVAETLAGWRPPSTPEGHAVLERHYQWGHQLRASGQLLFAGPIDVETMGPGAPSPVGRVTGMIVIRAASKDAAESLAHDEPFHREGFRKNVVHSWSLHFVQPEFDTALTTMLAKPIT